MGISGGGGGHVALPPSLRLWLLLDLPSVVSCIARQIFIIIVIII